MSIIICTNCGEMCHEHDQFCPSCGYACMVKSNKNCNGDCENCIYDMPPFGCGKPEKLPFVSPYPHSLVKKNNTYYYVEESDKRSRIGVLLFALLPCGAFGVHDFYARYYLRGIIHILLFVLGLFVPFISVGIALLVSWGIALVEGILVVARVIRTDGKEYPFA